MCSLSPSSLLPIKLKPGYSEKRTPSSSNSLFVSERRSKRKNILIVPLQGWANKIYRDEVVAEWKKVRGKISLHVHCRISGGHFLLDMFAKFGYYIFCKELPVVSFQEFFLSVFM
ncbi:BnaA01g22870D [Brassica napus]|uniref:(rape) hypothetical protein n=1 Tax=Brassica napus TaxID=3708 RepID=A0A078IBE4_BRANA|nr:unnamed protein product [Brassica napus]CDY47161.1 BnaA01g22870D [Brassica napus]